MISRRLDGACRVAEIAMSEFTFQAPEVYLPLGNGLIGVGDGWWVVKDCNKMHIAARVPNDDRKTVEFEDATADPEKGARRPRYVLKGLATGAATIPNGPLCSQRPRGVASDEATISR